MTKSQFNIKISKDLLTKVKRQAMMLGKSLTEHITDLVVNSLAENDIQNINTAHSSKIEDLEKRILTLESLVRNREYLSENLKPFNNSEAINCTKFMKGIFKKELEKRNSVDKSDAFDDFFQLVQVHDHLSENCSSRLKEIMLNLLYYTPRKLLDVLICYHLGLKRK